MHTGDILLIQSSYKGNFAWWSWLISKWTHSPWTHVAVIYQTKEDTFRVLESAYENGKWGVQTYPYNEYLDMYKGSYIVLRHLYQSILPLNDVHQRVDVILNTVLHTKYDTSLWDLVGTAFQTDKIGNPRNLNRMYCSALVAYFYTEMGWIDPNTNWTLIQPKDFSVEHQLSLEPGVKLGGAHLAL